MLVNNAGMSVQGRFADFHDLKLFKRVIDVNLYGAVHCTFHALPHLMETRGRIVNLSSVAGVLPLPHNTPYVASKFALNGFTDSLRMELSQSGVSVTTVSPAWVATEFHERLLDQTGKPWGSAGRSLYTERTMTPSACARIVVNAARRRKRHILMPPGALIQWLRVLAPRLADRLVIARLRKRVAQSAPESQE